MRKLLLAVMLAAPILLSACNTIAGLGKDVEAVGDAMTNSAEEAKN
jgi:predicted small secreted protein